MDENHATLSGHQKRLIRLFRTEAKTSCDLGGLVRRSAVSALDFGQGQKKTSGASIITGAALQPRKGTAAEHRGATCPIQEVISKTLCIFIERW